MNICTRLSCIAAAIVGTISTAGIADAALIVRDYATAGDGLLTYDTSTGLEWLDMSVSLGRAPLAALSTYSGFRLANREEAASLLVGAGIPAANIGYDSAVNVPGNLAAGQRLIATVGPTYSVANSILQGIYGRVIRADGLRYDSYMIEVRNPGATPTGTSATYLVLGNSLTSWQSNFADFLVRAGAPEQPTASVPEPGTWAMLLAGFGLVGLTLRSGRRAATVS